MENATRIHSLLLHSKGLKIREIAKELELDKSYVAETMFSTQNISFWYQDDNGLWYAKEGAVQIEEPKEDCLTEPLEESRRFNYERYLQGTPSASLRSFIYNISKYRLYSNQETLELISRYKDGDKKAFDLLIKSQQRLVVGLAYLYCKDDVQLEDLIQEGNIGLIRAIERFDFSQCGSFINYAKSYIVQSISYAMSYLPYIIRIPYNQLIQHRKICRYKELYENLNGFPPSTNDIKLDDDVDNERVEFLCKLPANLTDMISKDDLDNYEADSSPDYGLLYESLGKEVERSISTITHKEQEVIRLYFGLYGGPPMSLEEIGEKFDLTRERVRQVKEKAIRRLRHTSRSKILRSYYYV